MLQLIFNISYSILKNLQFDEMRVEKSRSNIARPWEPLSAAFRYYLTWLGSDGACDWWVWGCKGSLRDINITNVSTDSLVIMVHRCTGPAYSRRVYTRVIHGHWCTLVHTLDVHTGCEHTRNVHARAERQERRRRWTDCPGFCVERRGHRCV